jgi:hypothetical protein
MAVSENDEHASMLRIEKFSGEKFHLWKFKMQMVLEDKDLWGIANGNEVEPTAEATTETQRGNFKGGKEKLVMNENVQWQMYGLQAIERVTVKRMVWREFAKAMRVLNCVLTEMCSNIYSNWKKIQILRLSIH